LSRSRRDGLLPGSAEHEGNPKYAKTRLYARIDQRLDGRHGPGIMGCCRFVKQQHLWTHHQRADDREPQTLPRREPCDRPRLCLLGKAQVSDESKCRCPLAEVLADRIRPTARLGRHIADQAAPFGSGDGRAVSAIEGYQASIRIKIGDSAQASTTTLSDERFGADRQPSYAHFEQNLARGPRNPRRPTERERSIWPVCERTPCCEPDALVDGKVEMPKRPKGRRGWGILRLFLCAGAFALGLCDLAVASDMTAPIEQLDAGLLQVMKAGKGAPFQQRYDVLAPLVARAVELDDILQGGVGPTWASLSPRPAGGAENRLSAILDRDLRIAFRRVRRRAVRAVSAGGGR
jgi:hypothetical protein